MKTDSTTDPAGGSSHWIAVGIVAAAIVVRGSVCLWNLDDFSGDPDAYRAIAQTIADHGVFGLTGADNVARPTAFRPPLYPWLLATVSSTDSISNLSVAILHTVLGAVTALCTLLAARALLPPTSSTGGSIVAAGLVIVDPILLQQSSFVMTETLATAFASMAIWWWVCHTVNSAALRSALVLGLILAAAYAARPTFVVWAVLMAIATLAIRPAATRPGATTSWWWQSVRAGAIAAVVAIAVGGWMIRNARAVGHPHWATSHGGYTLLLGNNPLFYQYLRQGPLHRPWDADDFLLAYSHRYDADPTSEEFWHTDWQGPGVITAAGTEQDDDQLAYRAATATIARWPGTFVWSCIVRVYRLWTPIPHLTPGRSALATIAVSVYYLLWYAAIGWGLWRLGRRFLRPPWWAIATLVLTLTSVHAVYWSNLRMRAPAIPGLAILAAAAIPAPPQRRIAPRQNESATV